MRCGTFTHKTCMPRLTASGRAHAQNSHTQIESKRLGSELERTIKRAEASEEALAATRAEAQGLYENLTAVEANMVQAQDMQQQLMTRLQNTTNELKSEKERAALQDQMRVMEIE